MGEVFAHSRRACHNPSTHIEVGHGASHLYPQHARLGRCGHKQEDPVLMLSETVSKRKVGRVSEMAGGGAGGEALAGQPELYL